MDSGETKKLCRLRAWIPSGEGAISGDISRVIVKYRDYPHMLLGRWKPFTVSTAATCYIINVLLTADEWPIAFNMIGDGYHQLSHQGPAYIYCRHLHTYTHTRLTALLLGLPGSAGTRKVKPIWILLKQRQ